VTASEASGLYLRRWGREEGRPLLFLHALGPASSAAFLGLAVPPLLAAGYAVVAPDLPGHGRSAPLLPEEYAVPALAERIHQLADHLGWTRFVLVGHSWGGAISCHLAAAHPDRVRALVLVDSGHLDYADVPGADLDATVDELVARGEDRRLYLSGRTDVADLLEVPLDDPLVDAFLEGMQPDETAGLVSRTPGSASGPALYHLARSRQSETWPVIARHAIPTLLLLATSPDEARAVNEQGAARFGVAVPQAEVRWVTDATHSLITDERERFGTAVAEWLAALE